jgi:hypothetical protein
MDRSRRSTRSISGSSAGLGLALALVLGSFGSAQAEDPEVARQRSFREQYERASRAYNAKDYAAAIPALQAAFAIQPLPQILFNIAQAYRRLDKFGPARAYFELYRSMAGELPRDVAATVQSNITEMEEREKAAAAPKIVEKTRLLYVQSEKPPPRWLRPVGITAGVLGVGALAVGGTFLGLDGRCKSEAVAPALECEQVYSTKTLGTALTAVGAGVFVLGAVTFGLSLRRPSRPAVQEADAPPSDAPLLSDTLPALPAPPDAEPPPAGWGSSGARPKHP